MKFFGCLVYFKSNETKGENFEAKGRPNVFIGYPQVIKGYKIFDMKREKVIVSRDVRFHEIHFHFLKKADASNDDNPSEVFRPSHHNND